MIAVFAAILALSQKPVIVLPGADVTRTNPTWARADLGILDPLSDAPFIRRTFKIRNDGAQEVVLGAPQLTCACASALIGGQQMNGYLMASGAEAEVTVDIDPARLKVGHFEKYVWLTSKGRLDPIVTLELIGTMKPAVVFDPPSLRFGKLRAKDAKPLEVKVSLDRRLATLFPRATLECNVPDLVVQAGERTESTNVTEFRFTVALAPDARNGVINALARMVPGQTVADDPRAVVLKRRAQLNGVEVSVVGEIVGSFNASPSTVVFGNLIGGRTASRQISIISDVPIDPASFRIESKLTGLVAKFADSKAAKQLTLNVTFGGDLPGGAYDVQLIISDRKDEKLVVPVLAYITR